MSLRTGVDLISLTVLINKLSGVYGILAFLTGLHLSPLQLSMYIYSCFALLLTAFLAPHIRKQSPFQCLAFAWFYIIDTILNMAYTLAFSFTWFLLVSQHHSKNQGKTPPGGKTIGDTAGFTSPEYNVSHVDIGVKPPSGAAGQAAAVVVGTPGSQGTSASSPSLGHGLTQPESIPSLLFVSGLLAIRVYFILVIMAYARNVLRMHMFTASTTRLETGMAPASATNSPFSPEAREGQGWKGKFGRILVSFGREYWLGSQEDNMWARRMGGKFRKSNDALASGPAERERRRRSGTGPPPPQPIRPQELR
jgi:hypothetical protein